MRERYVRDLHARLRRSCRCLLVTLEYPQVERDGPPFSVEEAEVTALDSPECQVERIAYRPIPPDHPGALPGLSRFETVVQALHRR